MNNNYVPLYYAIIPWIGFPFEILINVTEDVSEVKEFKQFT